MSRSIRTLAHVATALIAAQTCLTAAHAVTGSCSPSRVKYQTAISQAGTYSTDFVVVPDTVAGITVGGATPSCVIVTFSASARAVNSIMFVRARIPGIGAASVAEPSSSFFTEPSGVYFKAHSMQFVFPNVPPGQHTVRIDYRSQNGQLVVVGTRTLTVQYRD